MTSQLRTALISLTLLFLSGCAFLNSFNSDLDNQVDVWMAQHEYSKILDTLKYVRPSNPKYQLLRRKRQQAIEESKRFEQSQISKALNQIEKEQWHEAEMTLTNAIEKLPDSKPLHKTYQEFIKQRTQYIKSLYTQLSINEAEWLIKNKPVQQKLNRTLPEDRKTQQELEDFRSDSQHVYQQLLACGVEATKSDDLELAEECYQLADKLQPNATNKETLADVRAKLDRKKSRIAEQKQKTPALSQLGRNLLDKSKKALDSGKLKLALIQYNKIPNTDRNQAPVKAYGEEMNRRIRDNVTQGIEMGRKLYSQGQVEQALAIWNKLRDLDPDNENLLSHIDRAERVLEKIKQLRKEQKPETQPTNPGNAK